MIKVHFVQIGQVKEKSKHSVGYINPEIDKSFF
jgi:hypothetical protein